MDDVSLSLALTLTRLLKTLFACSCKKSVSTLICVVGVLSDCFTSSKVCMFCRNNS